MFKMDVITDLNAIFTALKALLEPYHPPLTVRVEEAGRIDLWSVRDLVIEGRKRKEVFFASLIIQKGYVGFYFMPVYTTTEAQVLFSSGLLRLLKGKSCFHIKRLDSVLLEQVRLALQEGFALYRSRGWV